MGDGNTQDGHTQANAPDVVARFVRELGLYTLLAVFLGICWFHHRMAAMRIGLADDPYVEMSRAVRRNILMIDKIESAPMIPLSYALIILSLVLYLDLRRCPAWSRVMTVTALCMPCLVYLWVCLDIQSKFVF